MNDIVYNEKYYKAINFDFDTKKLKEQYPTEHWRTAYKDIQKFFKENGFVHRQGSGYVSKEKINDLDIAILSNKLLKTFPWLSKCVSQIDVTNIGATYSLKEMFDKSLPIHKTQDREATKHKPSPQEQIAGAKKAAEKFNKDRMKDKVKSMSKDEVSL